MYIFCVVFFYDDHHQYLLLMPEFITYLLASMSDRLRESTHDDGVFICSPCVALFAKLWASKLVRQPEDTTHPFFIPMDLVKHLYREIPVPSAISNGALGWGWRMQTLSDTRRCSSCFSIIGDAAVASNNNMDTFFVPCLFSYFKTSDSGAARRESAVMLKHRCYGGESILCGKCSVKYRCNPKQGTFFACPICYEMYSLQLPVDCLSHLQQITGNNN